MVEFRGKLCLFITLLFLSACSTTHTLPTTPNIYSASTPYPVENIAAAEQGMQSEIFYVTDRTTIREAEVLVGYEKNRSESMAFGTATVKYDENLSWNELVEISQAKATRPSVDVELTKISELHRFPATPLIFSVTPDGIITDLEEEERYQKSIEAMQKSVQARLKATNQSDIILYVHGFNTSFEDAILGLNDVWHFSGRHGVPIAYSWPSGSGNILRYFTDRESGEFTIFHFKETIRILSEIPEVNNIHLLAHSRGADITTSGLRELVIETRASGKDPLKTLKIKNLILAAPDLDYGVVTQRLIAEQFGPAFGQLTIYINESDEALGISQLLMKGVRFGKLSSGEQKERESRILENVKNVSFVNVKGVQSLVGHGYFSAHPGALSDIIKLIKTGAAPGTPERPLSHVVNSFWELDRTYLDVKTVIQPHS